MDPRDVVARGYDRIAARFATWAEYEVDDPIAPSYIALLKARLPKNAEVLDLGCGGGARLATLADHFNVTGVDISAEQVRRAQAAVPAARVLTPTSPA